MFARLPKPHYEPYIYVSTIRVVGMCLCINKYELNAATSPTHIAIRLATGRATIRYDVVGLRGTGVGRSIKITKLVARRKVASTVG